MLLMIDNYDSFTYNLVQALEAAGADVRVVRNDAIDRAGIESLADDAAANLRGIVVSPGPGNPDSAGVSMDAVRVAVDRKIPLLGVCLGMQAMAQAFGATVGRAPTLVHGEASSIRHDQKGLLAGMPSPFSAARYHSLSVAPETLPPEFVVTSRTEGDYVVMGIRTCMHRSKACSFTPNLCSRRRGRTFWPTSFASAARATGSCWTRPQARLPWSGSDGERMPWQSRRRQWRPDEWRQGGERAGKGGPRGRRRGQDTQHG